MSYSELKQRRDNSDLESYQSQMFAASEELASMVDSVAKAKMIREYDGERRKAALSRQVAPLLADGAVSASEHKARASEQYEKDMARLSQDLFVSEKTLAQYEATRCRWESCRSALSLAKTIAANI